MRLSKIAAENNFNPSLFRAYIREQSEIKYKMGLTEEVINDEDVPVAVEAFKSFLKATGRRELTPEEKLKQAAVASILVTSGFSFDGYTITRYSGYISGDDVVQLNRDELYYHVGRNLTDALSSIRIQALKELKEAAYDLGCNAIIGVDFDYITFEPQTANSTGGTTYQPYVVCVTANGNAVVIEKN